MNSQKDLGKVWADSPAGQGGGGLRHADGSGRRARLGHDRPAPARDRPRAPAARCGLREVGGEALPRRGALRQRAHGPGRRSADPGRQDRYRRGLRAGRAVGSGVRARDHLRRSPVPAAVSSEPRARRRRRDRPRDGGSVQRPRLHRHRDRPRSRGSPGARRRCRGVHQENAGGPRGDVSPRRDPRAALGRAGRDHRSRHARRRAARRHRAAGLPGDRTPLHSATHRDRCDRAGARPAGAQGRRVPPDDAAPRLRRGRRGGQRAAHTHRRLRGEDRGAQRAPRQRRNRGVHGRPADDLHDARGRARRAHARRGHAPRGQVSRRPA